MASPVESCGRQPEQPADQRPVGAHEPDRLAGDLDPGIVLRERPVAQPERALAAEVGVER